MERNRKIRFTYSLDFQWLMAIECQWPIELSQFWPLKALTWRVFMDEEPDIDFLGYITNAFREKDTTLPFGTKKLFNLFGPVLRH